MTVMRPKSNNLGNVRILRKLFAAFPCGVVFSYSGRIERDSCARMWGANGMLMRRSHQLHYDSVGIKKFFFLGPSPLGKPS